MTGYRETAQRLGDFRRQIEALRQQMRQLQAEVEPEEVRDYRFRTLAGEAALSELFGARRDLFMIHNMGTGCSSCTMWADGFNGILAHLEDRAAFVVSSPDGPDIQEAFRLARGWRFRMVSHQGSSFAQDMGFGEPGAWMPGVSVFRRDGGRILRLSDTRFDRGDDFCPIWRLLDLMPEGAAGWSPKASYQRSAA